VLLAVDGSEHAQAAARLVADLPLPAGSEVTAVAVHTPRETPRRSALLAALDNAEAILRRADVNVCSGLLHGHPAEELVRYADEHPPDLIVVGAVGLRATLGIFVGGIAQQVVEYARWPVLVVRTPFVGLRRGLFIEQAIDQQAEIDERLGQELLDQAAGQLRSIRLEVTPVMVRGDAATAILDLVKVLSVDLVVAGSRGLGAVKGWLLGSVSRKLVHYANCSVLLVRGEHEAGA
jgi:nucleotide-binding universal stress UspA family protein